MYHSGARRTANGGWSVNKELCLLLRNSKRASPPSQSQNVHGKVINMEGLFDLTASGWEAEP